jgi:uncharacterized protein (DUF779 family)
MDGAPEQRKVATATADFSTTAAECAAFGRNDGVGVEECWRVMVVVPEQVVTTPAAEELMSRLEEKHGELMFHQSGGCCDGSSPMCYPRGEFFVGDSDVLMAKLGETPFYMSKSQFEYWKHTQLILDVVPGRGGMFSLENGEGVRFLIRSRVFTDEEIGALRAAGRI